MSILEVRLTAVMERLSKIEITRISPSVKVLFDSKFNSPRFYPIEFVHDALMCSYPESIARPQKHTILSGLEFKARELL